MNIKLVESIAQVVLSLSEEERSLLYSKIKVKPVSPTNAQLLQTEALELENRLKGFESQYQMSSETFYHRFRAGELGDAMDFFEWSVFYEMWIAAHNHSEPIETKN
jgi:midasin (ATPase involved in ribosome maturation)